MNLKILKLGRDWFFMRIIASSRLRAGFGKGNVFSKIVIFIYKKDV